MAKRTTNPRVIEAVKEAVASILETEISDPRLTLVTVTDVRVTHDLSYATVFYSTLDPGLVSRDPRRSGGDRIADAEDVAAGLASARARIQSLLSQRVDMRKTPELQFVADPVSSSANRIEAVLRDLGLGDGDEGDDATDPSEEE